jgi:transposase
VEGHITGVIGLPGFNVLSAGRVGDEWELLIETDADLVGCPECGAVAKLKDRRPVWVRDLPIAGVGVVLCWWKRVWRCPQQLCPTKCWTETNGAIAARAVLTERARRWAFDQVARHDRAVASVAGQLGVGWHTIMRQVIERGAPLLADESRLDGVTAIGVDETSFLRATGAHRAMFATGIADLTPGRPPRLLDVVVGRSGTVLGAWLGQRDEQWRGGIRTGSLDPFRGYATALGALLPNATRVLDPFHVVKLALTCVDLVRRRVQQDTTGHRGRSQDPLFRCRRLLRRRADRLTPGQRDRLKTALEAGDPDGQIAAAWWIAQDIMSAYRLLDRTAGKAKMIAAIAAARACPIREVQRLARTLTMWRDELLARFDHPAVSNGPTENLNLKIKNTKRVARGYRNFDNYRLRLLLNHGGILQNQQATRIRTRRPTLVA